MAILDEIIELKKTSKITESVFLTKKELNRLNREGTSTYNFGDRILDMNIIEASEIVSDEEIEEITDALAKYEAYRKLIEEGKQ